MKEMSEDQLLEIARIGVENIDSDIPNKIDPASVSVSATIPFRALVIRTVMRARVAELTLSACDLLDQGKKVSAFILIRAVVESVALLSALNDRIERSLEERLVGDSGEYFNKLGWGSKNDIAPEDAINILTILSRIDNKYPDKDILEQYNTLSEISHPNWGGVIGTYSQFDSETLYQEVDRNGKYLPAILGLRALVTSIMLFENIYNETANLLPEFSKLCESELPKTE